MQCLRWLGVLGLVCSGVLQAALRWERPAQPEPYLIYIAYLDHDDTVTLRMVIADGSAAPQDLIEPRRDWTRFNRFTITHDERYLLFNVRDPSGTHARAIDLAGRPAVRWGGVGLEESFYSLMPDPAQALVAIADAAFQTFYLYQADIGGQQAQRLSDLKVSLQGQRPLWWGNWVVFQHITERGLGVAALDTSTGRAYDLSTNIPVAYLETVAAGWAYFVGYGDGQDGTIFMTRLDASHRKVIGQTATSFSIRLQVVDDVLLYMPPSDGINAPTVLAVQNDTTYPLLSTSGAVWYSSSVAGWVIVEVSAVDDGLSLRYGLPFEVMRVRPDGSAAETLPAPACYDVIVQAWAPDGRTHYTACYRDHRYWLAARALPRGDFIGQRYIDLPVQPELTVAPSGDWVLLRVVNQQGGLDYYRASADGQTLQLIAADAAQKDFATWYVLPHKTASWGGVLAAVLGGGLLVVVGRWRHR